MPADQKSDAQGPVGLGSDYWYNANYGAISRSMLFDLVVFVSLQQLLLLVLKSEFKSGFLLFLVVFYLLPLSHILGTWPAYLFFNLNLSRLGDT